MSTHDVWLSWLLGRLAAYFTTEILFNSAVLLSDVLRLVKKCLSVAIVVSLSKSLQPEVLVEASINRLKTMWKQLHTVQKL